MARLKFREIRFFYVISQPHLLRIFQDTSERKYPEGLAAIVRRGLPFASYFKTLYIAASLEIQYIFLYLSTRFAADSFR